LAPCHQSHEKATLCEHRYTYKARGALIGDKERMGGEDATHLPLAYSRASSFALPVFLSHTAGWSLSILLLILLLVLSSIESKTSKHTSSDAFSPALRSITPMASSIRLVDSSAPQKFPVATPRVLRDSTSMHLRTWPIRT